MHTIRLRDPWESELSAGRAIYRRHFNRPTGLTAADVVRLVVDELPAEAVVSFNGETLGKGLGVRGEGLGVRGQGAEGRGQKAEVGRDSWDITDALQLRNAIIIAVPAEEMPTQRPFGEVRLEILTSEI